jgi:hypothetical protein
MDQGSTVQKMFESEPREAEEREDVEKELQDMRVKRWQQKAVDRKEWVSVIKEAKALRRP